MKKSQIQSLSKKLVTSLAGLLAFLSLSATPLVPVAAAASDMEMSEESGGESAESAERARSGKGLEPTFLPREPEKKSWYNSDYIFGMTRGLANSTIAPGAKAPLFIFTIPLDIVTLPFTVIGGFFG